MWEFLTATLIVIPVLYFTISMFGETTLRRPFRLLLMGIGLAVFSALSIVMFGTIAKLFSLPKMPQQQIPYIHLAGIFSGTVLSACAGALISSAFTQMARIKHNEGLRALDVKIDNLNNELVSINNQIHNDHISNNKNSQLKNKYSDITIELKNAKEELDSRKLAS